MSTRPQKIPLLHGPYTPPDVRRGDRVFCLIRDCLVVVKRWHRAPISWPMGRAMWPNAGVGYTVDDELARALMCESAASVQYWFGISGTTVAKWRGALEVTRKNNEGSQILIHAATAKALDVAREVGLSQEECER